MQAAVGPGHERRSHGREGIRGCAHWSPPEGSVVAPVEGVPLDLEAKAGELDCLKRKQCSPSRRKVV